MEGFGFTPIEAAMYKTSVISSKETALFETTMGLLDYYEPATDFNVLSEKIYSVLSNSQNEEHLLKVSNTYEKTYSPLNQAKYFDLLFNQITKTQI